MKASPEDQNRVILRPPALIQSLTGGFNAVASHVHLIVLPVLLDMLLWFGPHLRLQELVWPFIQDLLIRMRGSNPAEVSPVIDNLQSIWQTFLEHFNLVSALSTFPLGIPSLMAGQPPIETPLGEPAIFEVNSYGWLVLGWLAFTLVGLILGSLYLALLARSCASNRSAGEKGTTPLQPNVLAWQTVQLLGFVVVLFGIFMVIMIPAVLISAFLAIISLGLAQIALLVILFGALWLLIPIVFAPHGIFTSRQSLYRALITSMSVVRYSLPGVSLFLMVVLLLYQGMSLLWRSAPASSWMALVGVLGHAFVSTSILAASFVYYHRALEYIQAIKQRQLLARQ